MKPIISAIAYLNIIIFAVLVSGCVSSMDNNGKTALPQYSIQTNPLEAKTGIWQTNDVQIDYSIEQTGSTFVPSASFLIKDRLLMSFNTAAFLHVYIVYIDKDGKALSTDNISPNIGYKKNIQGKYKLLQIPPAPKGTAAFTFIYRGNLVSAQTGDSQSSDWSIFFNPFR
jgi:hypothetical protein